MLKKLKFMNSCKANNDTDKIANILCTVNSYGVHNDSNCCAIDLHNSLLAFRMRCNIAERVRIAIVIIKTANTN